MLSKVKHLRKLFSNPLFTLFKKNWKRFNKWRELSIKLMATNSKGWKEKEREFYHLWFSGWTVVRVLWILQSTSWWIIESISNVYTKICVWNSTLLIYIWWSESHEVISWVVVLLCLKMVTKRKHKLFKLFDPILCIYFELSSSVDFGKGLIMSFLLYNYSSFESFVFI